MRTEADKPSDVDGTKLPTQELYGVSNTLMDRAVLILYYCFPEFRAKFPDSRGKIRTPQEVLRDFASFHVEFVKSGEEKKPVIMADHENSGYRRGFTLVEQSKDGGKTMILSSRRSSGMLDDHNSGNAEYHQMPFDNNQPIVSYYGLEAVGKIEDSLSNLVRDSQGQHQLR